MEKIWLQHYHDHQPEFIEQSSYDSLVDMLQAACSMYAQRPAFHSFGKTMSYAEFDRMALCFAAYLQHELNFKPGERVALILPNCLQYPVCIYGALRAGAVVVNVNPLYTADEMRHQLEDADVRVVVVMANFCRTLAAAIEGMHIDHVVVTELGDLLHAPRAWLMNFAVKYIKRMVPSYVLPQAISFRKMMQLYSADDFLQVPVAGHDLAFLQYTGGTTGVAKGAMLTHANLLANVDQVRLLLVPAIQVDAPVCMTVLPLYHIFSLTANFLIYAQIGAFNILVTNPRDIPALVKEMSRWRFNVFMAVNTLFNALLQNPQFSKLDFSALKVVVAGGMAVQKAVADAWQKVTGVVLIEGYGLTETSPVVSVNPCTITSFTGTVGVPLSSTEVSIHDEQGNELTCDQRGEIWVRGPQVMRGYWRRPDETDKVLTVDGWLKTGDIGMVDSQGFVRVVDRVKDMILVSGFNVYPNEVEDVLAMHPAVLEVGCVGVADEKSGEVVKAFVVLRKEQAITAEALRDYCREHLAAYKVPRYIEFREGLPKTNVGKILRRQLH